MSFHAIGVLGIIFVLSIMGIVKHPFWGLLAYMFIYFNIPAPGINWWAADLPLIRWSFISAGIVCFSMIIHQDKLYPSQIFSIKNYRYLIYMMAVMLLITVFWAVSPSVSWNKNYDFFRYLICFIFFIKCIPDMKRYDILVWLYIFCCFNLSVEAYQRPGLRSGGRLEGIGTPDSLDSNGFGSLLVSSIPFITSKLIYGQRHEKVIAAGMGVFILNGIILCASRGAFLGLATAMLFYFLLEAPGKAKIKLMLGGVVIAIIFMTLIDQSYLDRLLGLTENKDSTGAGRTEVWSYGIQMAKDHPLGVGGNGFEILSPNYMPDSMLTGGEGEVRRRAPHNSFLLVLVDYGIAGLILFLLFLKNTFNILNVSRKQIYRIIRTAQTDMINLKNHILAVEASIIGVLAGGMFTSRLYFEPFYWLSAMAVFLYLQTNILLKE